MAPNRKSLSALAQTLSLGDLESLRSTIQPKAAFLPLTHPSEEQAAQAVVSQQPQQQANDSSSSSYWAWSAEDTMETETVCILSTDNIVSNLIQQAAASQSLSSPADQQETLTENDAYWAEGEQQEEEEEAAAAVVVSAPQHESVSYWEWPAEEAVTTSQSASYWAWESDAVVRAEEEQATDYWAWETSSNDIAKLVLATTVLSQIKKEQETESNNYWTWNDDHDQYWVMPPATPGAAGVEATGGNNNNKGYWEW